MRKTKGTKRVQFEFSEVALKRLDSIVERTNAASRAEVVRNALRFYECVFEQHDNGFEICFKRDGKIFDTVPLPI